MEEKKINAPELNEEQLDSVSGGRGADEWNYFGPIKGQAQDYTMSAMHHLLGHLDPMPKEDKNADITGRV